MNEAPVFLFGVLIFLLVGAGGVLTMLEFRKMGNRDQSDSYPHPSPAHRKT